MTDQDIDALLNQYEWAGIKLGLERVRQLLAALGDPHQQMPMLHVAGTNGKGSVCAYVSSMLLAAGYRVGRYTSPHLVSWCERICVDDVPIAPSALGKILTDIQAAIPLIDEPPSQFEMITAAAWVYFAQQNVEIAVMEVGLGGRLDATNVCDRPLVSIITSISRDHAHILGDTLAAIAGEKAGILKPHCPPAPRCRSRSPQNTVCPQLSRHLPPAQHRLGQWLGTLHQSREHPTNFPHYLFLSTLHPLPSTLHPLPPPKDKGQRTTNNRQPSTLYPLPSTLYPPPHLISRLA